MSSKRESSGLLTEYFRKHMATYLLVTIVMVVGLIFGATYAATMGIDGIEISYFLETGFNTLRSGTIPNQMTIAQNSFKSNFTMAILIWLAGITVIGAPLILIALFIKGMSIGFTVSFLVKDLGASGGATAVMSVLPHNLLLIPMFILLGAVTLGFCVDFVKANVLKLKGTESSKPALARTAVATIISTLIIAAAAFVQAFVSPALLIMASRFI